MDKGKQAVKSKSSSGILKKFKLWVGGKKASVEITKDIDQQFEPFTTVFKNMEKGKLYGKGYHGKTKVVRYMFDERVRCTDENQGISFNLKERTKKYGMGMGSFEYIYVGAIIVAVKGLQMSSPGTKAIVALMDTRALHAEHGVIGAYEIDMSTDNGAIVYFCPNFPMVVHEFKKYIKVGIRTKGYDCQLLEGGVENLVIRTGFIGNKCKEVPEFGINEYEIGKKCKEIKAVPAGKEFNAREWNLEAFFEEEARERLFERQHVQFARMFERLKFGGSF